MMKGGWVGGEEMLGGDREDRRWRQYEGPQEEQLKGGGGGVEKLLYYY